MKKDFQALYKEVKARDLALIAMGYALAMGRENGVSFDYAKRKGENAAAFLQAESDTSAYFQLLRADWEQEAAQALETHKTLEGAESALLVALGAYPNLGAGWGGEIQRVRSAVAVEPSFERPKQAIKPN